MDTRQCTRCAVEKSVAEFGRKASECRRCKADREATRRALRPAKPPRHCVDCDTLIEGKGPQATLCASCGERRARTGQRRSPGRVDLQPLLQRVAAGETIEAVCLELGIALTTPWRRRRSDPGFAAELDAAEAAGKEIRLCGHGTVTRWVRGCRCDECKHAKTESSKQWRASVRSQAATASIPHGISGRQNYLCKCETCMQAQRSATRHWQRSRNDQLLDRARRHNQQWTGPELELAARRELSARQVAEMVGRTMYAVMSMRHRLEIEPKLQTLAGLALEPREQRDEQ